MWVIFFFISDRNEVLFCDWDYVCDFDDSEKL